MSDSAHICGLCPHTCVLREGQLGACRGRIGTEDGVVSENYGRITSLALDPIEKKPFARFMPGTTVLSLGSYGCNLHCPWCQNASISMVRGDGVRWTEMTPQEIATRAKELEPRRCIGVAYTYNEPLISMEFVLDTARLVKAQGQRNVLVSNGTVSPGPLHDLLPLLDAANIDLKAFDAETYRAIGGDLDTVKGTIETIATDFAGTCHLEVTTLIIPDVNDSEDELRALVAWLASLSSDIPLHISRFFPRYKMSDAQPTPISTIERAVSIAREKLRYVYRGNC